MVFLEFLSVFGLLEVFRNFWLKNGEVSWKIEDFGIFDENGVFADLLDTYRGSNLVTKSAKLG